MFPYFYSFLFFNSKTLHLINIIIALILQALDNIKVKKIKKGFNMKKKYLSESIMKYVFLVSALTSIFAIVLICFFIFGESMPL